MSRDKKLDIRMRPAEPKDIPRIMNLVMDENMNPLIGPLDRFIVFEEHLGNPSSVAQANRNRHVIGCGQIRRGVPAEMSTVVVDAAWRQHGVGSLLVSEPLKRYGSHERVVLITLLTRCRFYQRHGFKVLDEGDRAELPLNLRVEFWLGTFAARFFAPHAHFICMAREAGQSTKLCSVIDDVLEDQMIGWCNVLHHHEQRSAK